MFEDPYLLIQEILKIHKYLTIWANWLIAIPMAIAIFLAMLGIFFRIKNHKTKSKRLTSIIDFIFVYSGAFVLLSFLIFFVLIVAHAFGWIQGILLFLFIAFFLIPYFRSISTDPIKVKKSSWILFALSIIFYIIALIIGHYHIKM